MTLPLYFWQGEYITKVTSGTKMLWDGSYDLKGYLSLLIKMAGLIFYLLKHSPLRDGCCGGRETALCLCLLRCWNSALSANPFNSRPAVFVWADIQAPTLTSGWTLYVPLLTSVDLLLTCCWTIILSTTVIVASHHLENSHGKCSVYWYYECKTHYIYIWLAAGCEVHPVIQAEFRNLFLGLCLSLLILFFPVLMHLFPCSFSLQPKRSNVCRRSLVEQQL